MEGISANGLLLLHPENGDPEEPFYVCNPITREYIVLSRPKKYISLRYLLCYGFGVSEISGQYKVICISRGGGVNCFHVYTLGTRKWRLVKGGAGSRLKFFSYGHTVCNGNLHWMVSNFRQPLQICGFDVVTERFSIFYAPPVEECFVFTLPLGTPFGKLSVLKEKLCFCYSWDFEIVVWVMKEYGDAGSWTKEYTMGTYTFDFDDYFCMDWTKMKCVFPIEIFKDGDVLILMEKMRLIYYSKKTRKTQQVGLFKNAVAKKDYFTFATIFTPSLLSLKSFEVENVVTF
ncbi:F-box protein CPR1-like [Salvia hispanica]|uniref:F-box protein CPR1-like n=1 Tax=Salvia hispanica TaxID=49212 RepID=UPI002008F836|nr:F-box protein CPR1-like [Salvia hispanica]